MIKNSLNLGLKRSERLRDLLKNKTIVLVGMMGSGKTEIGKYAANFMDVSFCDIDIEIECRYKMKISEIFSRYGENYFRVLELKTIKDRLNKASGFVSFGGGAFVNPIIRQHAKDRAITCWLKVDMDVLLKRLVLNIDSRPVLQGRTGDKLKIFIESLLKARIPYYQKALIQLDVSNLNIEEASYALFTQIEAYAF